MRIAAAAAAAAIMLVACGSPAGQAGTGYGTAAPAANVKTDNNAKFGKILVAANGMTLYVFDKDTANTSNCYDACATNWPPLTVTADPVGDGINGKLATATRKDGAKQVTLDGKPLYFWKNDQKPGDATGDGVQGVWHVVKNP